MKPSDFAEAALAFLVGLILTTGACAKQAVTCGPAEARAEAPNVAKPR